MKNVACKPGCKYSCGSKAIYLFSLRQVKSLRSFCEDHGLMEIMEHQYQQMSKCTNMEDVKKLGLVCPFMEVDTRLCRVHHYDKPHPCAVWTSPDIEFCKDPTKFPEWLAIENNSKLPYKFDCVWELRAAMVGKPDNLKLTYGDFIDVRRDLIRMAGMAEDVFNTD